MTAWLRLAPALANAPHAATVALESTVISHDLPYPHNLRLVLCLEEIVRDHGAEPATSGIIRGEIVVGLDRGQIERLATVRDVRKVGRRDLLLIFNEQRSCAHIRPVVFSIDDLERRARVGNQERLGHTAARLAPLALTGI